METLLWSKTVKNLSAIINEKDNFISLDFDLYAKIAELTEKVKSKISGFTSKAQKEQDFQKLSELADKIRILDLIVCQKPHIIRFWKKMLTKVLKTRFELV